MTLVIKDVRKVAVLGWQTEGDNDWTIKGADASLQVEGEEKRTVKNDGESNLFFPLDFSGDVTVTVRGSASGEDGPTTLHVS
jgi:hypothetical protein